MLRPQNIKTAIAGILFMIFAGALAIQASQLELGTASRMGPGYFPLLLSKILGLLGFGIFISAFIKSEDKYIKADWRGLFFITLAVITFGFLLERLGFLASVAVSSLLSSFAIRPINLIGAVILVCGLSLFCTIVFVWGLKLPVQLIKL